MLALLLAIAICSGLPITVNSPGAIVFFIGVYVALSGAILLEESGFRFGFQFPAALIIFFTFSPFEAILILLIGTGLFAVIDAFRYRKRKPVSIGWILTRWALDWGINAGSILVGSLVYRWFGHQLPMAQMGTAQILPYIAMILARTAYYSAFLLVFLQLADPTRTMQRATSMLSKLISVDAIILPVAFVIANERFEERLMTAIPISLTAVVSAAFYYRAIRSERRLNRQIAELDSVNTVGQSMSISLSLHDLLEKVYQTVAQVMRMPMFYIATHDPEDQLLHFPLVMIEGKPVISVPRPMGNGASEYVMRTAELLLVRGTFAETAEQFASRGIVRKSEPVMCYLGVPIIADQEVLGVMTVQSYDDPQAFGEREVTLLKTVAAQIATAMRNAVLYNRLTEMAEKLARLKNVSSVVTASLDLDKVLNTICTVAIEISDADRVGIFLASENGTALRLVYSIGLSDDYVALFQNIARSDDSDSGPMQVMRQTGPLAIPDIRTDPRGRGWRSLAEVEGYVGLITVPLVASDSVIGFLAAFYNESRQFNRSELDTLSTLANQVAVAVANARLHDDTEARARELSRLVDASRMFTASLDLASVAATVFEALNSVLRPDTLALYLLKPHGNLEKIMNDGLDLSSAPGLENAIQTALDHPHLTILPQASHDLKAMQQLNLSTLYVLPIISQEKAFGAVVTAHKNPHHLTNRERQLVEGMVNQAATAIRNAQLFEQIDAALEDRISELSAIEAISRKISGVLDLETIINDVLDVAMRNTGADVAGFFLTSRAPEQLSLVERRKVGNEPPVVEVMERNEGITGRVLRTGQIARVDDVRLEPDYVEGVPGILSELTVPITNKGERVGAINLESRSLAHFTPSHERFMVNLAEHAAIALGNARLFDERQHQIETLTRLRNLSLELLSSTSYKQVMKLIVEYTLIITHAKDVHLYTYDAANDALRFGASLWVDGREDVEATPPSAGGRTHQVARSGQMFLIPDVSQIKTPDQFKNGNGYGAVARIPLKRAGHVLGVLTIAYRDPTFFSENDVRLFDLIAAQSAIALENARLFEEVRTGRDQMQTILESMRDGMILVNAVGELALANRAAEQLLSYPLRMFQGQNILRLAARARQRMKNAPNLSFWTTQIHELLDKIKSAPDRTTRREYSIQSTEDGNKSHEIEESTLPVFDDSGTLSGRLIVLRDVTEEREMKQFQDQISDMLVHDLRSPLAGVISSLNMISDMIDSEEYEDIQQVVGIALTSSDKQMRMIESLMDIRKLRTGRMPLSLKSINVYALTESAVTALGALAAEAEIHLKNLIPVDFPMLCVDQDSISRVIFNLLDNALRHTPSGGEVRIEARILDTLNQDRDRVPMAVLSVTDTGKGIAPDQRERVFEMFIQVPKSALRGHRGSGLGLTYCKLTIEAHGGRIWVEGGPEGGAAFLFTLPLLDTQKKSSDPMTDTDQSAS